PLVQCDKRYVRHRTERTRPRRISSKKFAKGAMRNHSARAMYDQLEDMLTSKTMQLRSAIAADARPPQAGGRARGWARRISAELASVLIDTLGLAATIEWHVRQYQKCTGILCELTVSSVAGFDLPGDYAATIYDIYNEA